MTRDTQARLVALVCAYEVAAIVTGRLPTITAMSHRARVDRYKRLPLFALWGWLSWHIWCEEGT